MAELPDSSSGPPSTAGTEYTDRLRRLGDRRWKRLLDVQAPYRWNIRRLKLGRTLDVGCGIGRNLEHLGGNAVGVDHNGDSVEVARSRGLSAFTVEEFMASELAVPATFDSLLVAHVVEHLAVQDSVAMLRAYLPFARPGGRVCFITPQEVGYRSDATHVRFVGFAELDDLAQRLGIESGRRYSFPLPRVFGKVFRYNEFVYLAEVPAA